MRPSARRVSPPGPVGEQRRGRFAIYIGMLLATILATAGYKLRTTGLFACDAAGYRGDRYVAYCQASAYGDYDYGAFWYDLEPSTEAAAKTADVLFVGNSRAQFALSSNATANWFEARAARYYLLGFAYNGNMAFAAPLLRRLQPKARVYVISVDLFFREQPTPPAQEVMRDSAALGKYREKQFSQRIHSGLCARVAVLCGQEFAYYRRRSDGAWVVTGAEGRFQSGPAVYSDSVDQKRLAGEIALARSFVSHLPVSRDCVLLTLPAKGTLGPGTSVGTARAIADTLGLTFMAPQPAGLSTFDGSHLDRRSAELWSSAFLSQAAPKIQKCLERQRL
jgi:hypothetical protein